MPAAQRGHARSKQWAWHPRFFVGRTTWLPIGRSGKSCRQIADIVPDEYRPPPTTTEPAGELQAIAPCQFLRQIRFDDFTGCGDLTPVVMQNRGFRRRRGKIDNLWKCRTAEQRTSLREIMRRQTEPERQEMRSPPRAERSRRLAERWSRNTDRASSESCLPTRFQWLASGSGASGLCSSSSLRGSSTSSRSSFLPSEMRANK